MARIAADRRRRRIILFYYVAPKHPNVGFPPAVSGGKIGGEGGLGSFLVGAGQSTQQQKKCLSRTSFHTSYYDLPVEKILLLPIDLAMIVPVIVRKTLL